MEDRRTAEALAIGIDVGGSYTDMIVRRISDRRVIARAKARTTYNDMTIGLDTAMNEVCRNGEFDFKDVRFVGLSTTLATNSILEGKGGKVGLICIGWEPETEQLMRTERMAVVKGGYDYKGKVQAELDRAEIESAAKEMSGTVDMIVLSSKFGHKFPDHEKEAKRIVASCTDTPVIASVELKDEIGAHERANTAILNAMLIPVINNFLDGVKRILSTHSIDANVMMMKADGSMMRMKDVRNKPVETIMSGPAASLVGGLSLSGCSEGVVVDVGSTSTDIACIHNGMLPLNKEGAKVFDRKTHIRTMDVLTIAMGGDSHIYVRNGKVKLGPDRAEPIAVSAAKYHDLIPKMLTHRTVDFLVPHMDTPACTDPKEQEIVDFVTENAPCLESELFRRFAKMNTVKDVLRLLLKQGRLIYTSLTPTDLMLMDGVFELGMPEASRIAASIVSESMDLTYREFRERTFTEITRNIGSAIIKKVIWDRRGRMLSDDDSMMILDAAMTCSGFGDLGVRFRLDVPLVGLGGPARTFMASLSDVFSTDVITPENNDVGNAAGTISGKITTVADAYIYPAAEGGYEVRKSFDRMFGTMYAEEALQHAEESALAYATKLTSENNCSSLESYVEKETYRTYDDEEVVHVRAVVSGDPLEYLAGYSF